MALRCERRVAPRIVRTGGVQATRAHLRGLVALESVLVPALLVAELAVPPELLEALALHPVGNLHEAHGAFRTPSLRTDPDVSMSLTPLGENMSCLGILEDAVRKLKAGCAAPVLEVAMHGKLALNPGP